MRACILVACLLLLFPAFGQAYDCDVCVHNWQDPCFVTARCQYYFGGGWWDNCTVFYNEMGDPSCPDLIRVIEYCDGDDCYWT
jgi:hypothetical protein